MSEASSGRPTATATPQIDDGTVRVTRWDFPPGAETGAHRHGFDYVVVPLTDGEVLIETADGPQNATLIAGASYGRSAGVEHNVVNRGDAAFSFVEIELLDQPG